jgi:hypothetical protein
LFGSIEFCRSVSTSNGELQNRQPRLIDADYFFLVAESGFILAPAAGFVATGFLFSRSPAPMRAGHKAESHYPKRGWFRSDRLSFQSVTPPPAIRRLLIQTAADRQSHIARLVDKTQSTSRDSDH